MNSIRYNRKKRIIIAYALRATVTLLAAAVITLMVCGGLYLFETFQPCDPLPVLTGKEVNCVDGNNHFESDYVNHKSEEKDKVSDDDSLPEDSCFTVVLDAGHGGNDGGTYNDNIIEKDINLSVVVKMQKLLESEGVNVILTREEDEYVSLEERADIANHAQADLFLSIHCNYFEDDSSVSGLECYYCEGSDKGLKYAEQIMEVLEANGDIKTREIKESDYFVLTQTNIPAVLVEMGFLSNLKECKKLASEKYQEVLAEEIVKGILGIILSVVS